ncbi:tetratricopeptide repeat protein (macronuclear) [Tetrahymena thermophila SB210]|uniref:Tetratricopeptide repeat protein n=1 Tax=Tetrahymena thermophila (strain SB210) TaxID=312017 RepID=Q23YS4_TETTS|nr:tetratricopeptide repeat protein [Tetrahymena thermophila SB210]EAS01731.1 tetratricopeptide repeat protein [Tetrahymena thermophila SB210]|eukprot:XP_001021976.1 tetratricopeptide repeat protein [Tetrahymena thermophila SB210]
MSNIRSIQNQKRHLFIDLSEESYGLLMKNQLQKSLEKILEAENQLYKKISKGQMKKFSTEISNMYYIKGLILDRMKDLPKSLLAYQRAFEENKKNKSICNNIGKVYLQLLNYEEAEKYLLWALQLDDKLLQAYVNLAYLYFEITDFDKCLMICNEALSRNIQDFMLFEYLGICNVIHRKNYSESLVNFYQYMSICNKNKFKPSYLSLYYMSYALLLESKYDESLKYIESAIYFYPQEGEAYFLRAQVFYNLQKLEQAEQDITKYAQIKNIQLICVDSQINSHLSGIDDTQFENIDQKADQIKELINKEENSNSSPNNINQNINSDQKQISYQNQTQEFLKDEETKDMTKKNSEMYVNTEQNHLIQEEKLNIYFQMGLIYMQKANQISSTKDFDKLFNKQKLQQKAIQYFEEANSIQYQFPIVFNLGLLLEEIGQNDDSFQVLQKSVIKHFENSNDEFYLNSDNYHILNLLFLNIFKLNYLQKYQQNLNQILSYDETEQSKAKLSIDSKTATDTQDLQAINSKYFSDVIYPRRRKISITQVKNIKESLSCQINQIKRNIALTKSQLIEIVLHKLNQINKQKLILSNKQEQYKQTIVDLESFISPQLQTQGFSIISEENIRTNIRTSYLQSCDDLNKLEQQRHSNQSDFQEDSQDILDSSQSPKNAIAQDTNLQENKENQMPNQQLKTQNSRENSEANRQGNENSIDMRFRKMSSKGCSCSYSTENSTDKSNCKLCCDNHQTEQKQQGVNQNKKLKTQNEEEEEEEEEKSFLQDEENEEYKLQKQREQEKEKIIKYAKIIFEKQKQEQQVRIQKLKLEANKKQEEEYKQEKQKLYDQIKLIQREYDDIIQQFKSLLNQSKNNQYQFFPQCIACNPLYRRSDLSSRDESDSQKTQEDNPKSSQLESHQIQENQQNKQKELPQISSSQSTNGEISSPNAINTKLKCECDKIKNQILNYNSFLKSKNFERDFFFAFKRVIKNTFLHSRYIIDSLYSKSSITISSLAELSLGFIPLFQSDLLLLDKDNSQIQIVSNEILVKKCYVILSLSDSVENLHQILDSLSAALSVYLSEYMQEYYHNTSENIYPDNWGDKMNQVLDLLKNSYEISFELLGESYAYFIFYQFFAKFIDNEEELIKYKEKHMQDRAQFLFNFILSNIKFSPIEFFKTKMNPPKQVLALPNLAPNPTRIKTNISSNTDTCNVNESHIKSVSNYGQSEAIQDSSILRRSSKKQKKNSVQRQEKCLCNIY